MPQLNKIDGNDIKILKIRHHEINKLFYKFSFRAKHNHYLFILVFHANNSPSRNVKKRKKYNNKRNEIYLYVDINVNMYM